MTSQALPALALGAALLLWRDVRMFPRPLERWTESYMYPKAGLRFLQALNAGPRVLNYYNWGGFIMLHAPELKVIIDGRANTLYSERLYNDYVAMIGSRDGLPSRLALYAPDVALLPGGSGSLASTLASSKFGWRVLYADDVCAVLLPPDSPRLRSPLPNPEDVVGDEPQWLLARAGVLSAQGRAPQARELAERALAMDSFLVRGYGVIAESYALERNLPAIAAAIDRGLAVEPRFYVSLRQFEANAYMDMGATDLALAALQSGIPRGPFSRPEGMLENIEVLRARAAGR